MIYHCDSLLHHLKVELDTESHNVKRREPLYSQSREIPRTTNPSATTLNVLLLTSTAALAPKLFYDFSKQKN